MRRVLLILLVFVLACTAEPDGIPRGVVDLRDELESGRVQLVWARGNGSSSGASIHARLANTASVRRRINVSLTRPLFLANGGIGQNMAALAAYMADGRYESDGSSSFITLDPNRETDVLFVAFCMDFYKNNPTSTERFAVGEMPPSLLPVLNRIQDYLRANPDADATSAAQAALWLAQGVSLEEIRSRFDLTGQDISLAHQLAY